MTNDLTDQEKALIVDKIREKYTQGGRRACRLFFLFHRRYGPAAAGLPRGVVAGFSPGLAGVFLRGGQSL